MRDRGTGSVPVVAASERRRPDRRGLTLRGVFILTVIGVAIYIGGFGLAIQVQVAPIAAELRRESDAAVAASAAVANIGHSLDSALRRIVADGQLLLFEMRDGQVPDPDRTAELDQRLRTLIESSFSIQTSHVIPDLRGQLLLAVADAVGKEAEAIDALIGAISLLDSRQWDAAWSSFLAADSLRQATLGQLDVVRTTGMQAVVERERQFGHAVRRTLWTLTLWGALGLFVISVLVVFFRRRLYGPLSELDEGLSMVTDGELDVQLYPKHQDELGRLHAHFNEMTAVLRARADREEREAQNLTARLGRVLEEASNEIYIFDAESLRFLQVNLSAQRNLKMSLAELLTRTPVDLLRDHDRPSFERLLQPLRDGTTERVVMSGRHRRADGSLYPVETILQLSKAEAPPVFLAIAQDTSERLRVQAERDRVFDLSVDLLATATVNGELTRVNSAFERTLGIPREEFKHRRLIDFLHANDHEALNEATRALGRGEPVRGLRVRLRTKDRGYRWISWNVDPPENGLLYVVGRDVTEVHVAEVRQAALQAAIERSASEWTMTFDALAHPILILDDTGTVVRLNEAARRLAGTDHRDILGRPIDAVARGDFWQRAGELVQSVRTGWRAASSQVHSAADRRTWNIELTPVIGSRAGGNAIIAIAHDITMTVRLQESLRRNETMAAMGSLVAGVAHEVRNPLFGMSATLEAFEAQQELSARTERHMTTLRAQLDRLKCLMQELLEYGRPQSLDLKSVPYSEVVGQAIEATERVAREREVVLESQVESALPPVRIDRMRMVQVLVNLVSNAVQHTPNGGRVTVRAFSIQQGSSSWLETVVEDDGPGIDPDDLPRLFEPFYTRRSGGTGLGLALVERILDQHGGTVAVENRPNGGALFRFRLPLPEA